MSARNILKHGPVSVLKGLSTVVLSLLTYFCSAQILVGPQVGAQLDWYTFDDKSNKDFFKAKPTVGFHVGGAISFRVKKRFFLQSALMYNQKSKVIEGTQDLMLNNRTTLRYVDIPILYTGEFSAKVGKTKGYKWYLGAGPDIKYWISSRGALQNTELSENSIEKLNYKVTFKKAPESVQPDQMNVEEPNRIQLGLLVSAGIIFEPLGMQKIMLSLRYEIGSSFLAKTKGMFPDLLSYQDELRIRNNALALSAIYFIDLKMDQRMKGKSTIKLKNGRPVR